MVRRVREPGLVLVGSLVVAVVTTWPLAADLDHAAHNPYDPVLTAWILDWVQHAVLDGAPLWDANAFTPSFQSLTFSDAMLGLALPLLPLRWLGVTPIGMVNAALLLGTAANLAAGYVLGRVVLRTVPAAIVVAAATGVGPFPSVLAGHVHVLVHPGVPLAAALVWAYADGRQAGDRRSRWSRPVHRRLPVPPLLLLLVVTVAWQSLVSFYTAAFTLLAAGVAVLVRAGHLGVRGTAAVAACLAVASIPVLSLASVYLETQRHYEGDYEFDLADGDRFGLAFEDLLQADPRLRVWGDTLGADVEPLFDAAVFPGVIVLVLAVAGAVGAVAGRDGRRRRAAVLGAALLGAGFVLALGGDDEGWRSWLPYRWLYEVVPGWSALRSSARFAVVAMSGLAVLAGVGADWLLGAWSGRRSRTGESARAPARRGPPPAVAAALAAGALLGVEGSMPWSSLDRVEVQPVDELVDGLPPGGVAYLPMTTGLAQLDQNRVLYRSTAHHRAMPNGYAGFTPPSYEAVAAVVASFPDSASVACLTGLGVRYVVVGDDVDEPGAGRLDELRLEVVAELDGEVLLALPSDEDGSCPGVEG